MNVVPSSFPIPIGDSCTLTPNLVSGEWFLQGSISTSSAAGCEDTQYTNYSPGQAVTITVSFAKTGYDASSATYTWTPST
jgi:hypothetical protein